MLAKLCSHLEDVGWNVLPNSFRLLAEFSFLPCGTEVFDFLLAIHTEMNKNFCCSTFSPAFVTSVLDFVHSISSVVMSHFLFICLDDIRRRTSYTYLLSVYHLW